LYNNLTKRKIKGMIDVEYNNIKRQKAMDPFKMQVSVRKIPQDPNMFEFIITTPTLKTQFILPREMVNKLRILIEKVLTTK